jgi:hypothetical protein
VALEIGDDITFWAPASTDDTANSFKFTLIGDLA